MQRTVTLEKASRKQQLPAAGGQILALEMPAQPFFLGMAKLQNVDRRRKAGEPGWKPYLDAEFITKQNEVTVSGGRHVEAAVTPLSLSCPIS